MNYFAVIELHYPGKYTTLDIIIHITPFFQRLEETITKYSPTLERDALYTKTVSPEK